MVEGLRDVLKRPVLVRDRAETIGRVKAVLVDQPPRRVTALHVDGSAKKALLVDWARSRVGPDAVVVDTDDALRPVADDAEDAAVRHHRDLLGARALDTRGFEHGTVEDAEFDTETGELTAVVVEGHRVDASRLRGLGTYALVVDLSSGTPDPPNAH